MCLRSEEECGAAVFPGRRNGGVRATQGGPAEAGARPRKHRSPPTCPSLTGSTTPTQEASSPCGERQVQVCVGRDCPCGGRSEPPAPPPRTVLEEHLLQRTHRPLGAPSLWPQARTWVSRRRRRTNGSCCRGAGQGQSPARGPSGARSAGHTHPGRAPSPPVPWPSQGTELKQTHLGTDIRRELSAFCLLGRHTGGEEGGSASPCHASRRVPHPPHLSLERLPADMPSIATAPPLPPATVLCPRCLLDFLTGRPMSPEQEQGGLTCLGCGAGRRSEK